MGHYALFSVTPTILQNNSNKGQHEKHIARKKNEHQWFEGFLLFLLFVVFGLHWTKTAEYHVGLCNKVRGEWFFVGHQVIFASYGFCRSQHKFASRLRDETYNLLPNRQQAVNLSKLLPLCGVWRHSDKPRTDSLPVWSL